VLLLTILGSFLLARSIANPISRAVYELNAGSSQVADASGQVALASQSLAEGTSALAASLEETSATLEELTTMTGKNAQSAAEADSLMREVGDMTEAAGKSMEEMRGSMEEISSAGQEISKIIKSIDEIAFQTNLLALNAAVEAARAGEAGAGFAVVADEVRSLAMRAAEAAKNTSTLIEGTIHKINQGGQIAGQVDQAFGQVIDHAHRVGILVGEISSGSQEQSEGIGQINKAVQDMDNVTQQTAANSEESAAASEEMSAQAEEIRGVVNSLAQVVGGGKSSTDMMESQYTQPAEKKRLLPGPKNETLERPPMPDEEMKADDFSDF
jgi:methyl-accepting chemotaxis protein